ncbi:MAG: carboxy-S-adenosyl-L-methionine synthase CmoA [Kiritimatiellaeota bacterium]|nr:carboxy-S-adenosyl-L-methionine synthase CmoA [Kiritimatiellota bacterium]
MKKKALDDIYSKNEVGPSKFEFNAQVAEVFPDMIRRSVPGYARFLDIVEMAAAKFAAPKTCCCDLGCSLGAAALRMEKATGGIDCEIVAVDNSKAMIERLRKLLESPLRHTRIIPVFSDILDLELRTTSFAVMGYTLQFVPLERRAEFLGKLRNAMTPGAALVLSEKMAFDSATESELMNSLHFEFKKRNGYSELEIARKRTALENVLLPETLDTHAKRLRSVGFSEVLTVSRYLNFATLIALA